MKNRAFLLLGLIASLFFVLSSCEQETPERHDYAKDVIGGYVGVLFDEISGETILDRYILDVSSSLKDIIVFSEDAITGAFIMDHLSVFIYENHTFSFENNQIKAQGSFKNNLLTLHYSDKKEYRQYRFEGEKDEGYSPEKNLIPTRIIFEDYTFDFGYDEHNRLTYYVSDYYTSGVKMEFSYDEQGRLIRKYAQDFYGLSDYTFEYFENKVKIIREYYPDQYDIIEFNDEGKAILLTGYSENQFREQKKWVYVGDHVRCINYSWGGETEAAEYFIKYDEQPGVLTHINMPDWFFFLHIWPLNSPEAFCSSFTFGKINNPITVESNGFVRNYTHTFNASGFPSKIRNEDLDADFFIQYKKAR